MGSREGREAGISRNLENSFRVKERDRRGEVQTDEAWASSAVTEAICPVKPEVSSSLE